MLACEDKADDDNEKMDTTGKDGPQNELSKYINILKAIYRLHSDYRETRGNKEHCGWEDGISLK